MADEVACRDYGEERLSHGRPKWLMLAERKRAKQRPTLVGDVSEILQAVHECLSTNAVFSGDIGQEVVV